MFVLAFFQAQYKRLPVPSRPHRMRSTICALSYNIYICIHTLVFDFSVIIFYPFLLFPSVLKSALSRNRTIFKAYIYHFCIVYMYMHPSIDIKGFGSVLASIIWTLTLFLHSYFAVSVWLTSAYWIQREAC